MVEWNTAGLPPAAQRRMDNISSSHIRSSLLSIPGATGIQSVGFYPASEVMGATVVNTNGAVMPSCGMAYQSFGMGANQMYGSSRTLNNGVGMAGSSYGYTPYIDVINSGWSSAISRMMLEATQVKADGVVDIRLSQNQLGSGAVEFVAMGTAVRSMGPTRLTKPFSTHLGGGDFSKLLRSCYVPVAIIVEVSVAIRHDDYTTYAQSNVFAPNSEISGFTDLVTSGRANARERLRRAVSTCGAQGAIIDSLTMHVFEFEPYENHRDHIAEVRAVGTAIASFATTERASSPLSILSLKDK